MTRSRTIVVTIIIALFIWTFFYFSRRVDELRAKTSEIIGLPVEVLTKSINYFNRLSLLSRSSKRVNDLEEEIRTLKKELIDAEEARLENERLRKLLNFKKNSFMASIPAFIIGRDPNNWSSVVFIDRGESDGIIKDMVVISGAGLVGRIREVGLERSKVMLINDVDSKVGAIIHQTRDQGLLIGAVDGRCKLIYLPMDTKTVVGDEILTSGMGGIFPKGISIGRIKEVEKERGRLYKYAIVEPASKLSRLEEVLCIK